MAGSRRLAALKLKGRIYNILRTLGSSSMCAHGMYHLHDHGLRGLLAATVRSIFEAMKLIAFLGCGVFFRHGPRATLLESQSSTFHSDVARFTPVFTPRVANHPIPM